MSFNINYNFTTIENEVLKVDNSLGYIQNSFPLHEFTQIFSKIKKSKKRMFKGKVAVVTGGARDIGRSISVQLAKEGAKVVVNYYNSEAGAKETVEEIKSMGGEAIAVKADVSNINDIKNITFNEDLNLLP